MSIPLKSQIVEHWMDRLDRNAIDWTDPSCWACKKFWWGQYDIYIENLTFNEILNNWNKVKPLERCHIVPKQFGGSNRVDNLFLMCKECHDRAPNTRSKIAFLSWAEQQCYVTNLYKEIINEIKTYGLENKIDQINELFKAGIPHQITEN